MLTALFVALGCGASSSGAPVNTAMPPEQPPPSIADNAYLDQYAATRAFRLGHPQQITITPDGDAILFLRSGPRTFVQDLYSFDVASGQERVLLTADGLLGGQTEELSPEERARRERQRMASRGIARFELSKDGRRVLVPLSDRLFVVERASTAVVELPMGTGFPNDAHFSPDAAFVSCVRNGDLYVIDVAARTERRLTTGATERITHGLAEFVAQEEMGRYEGYWWSPDGRSIAYQRTDTSAVETLHILDPMHPQNAPAAAPYPRPGHPNADVQLGIVPVRGGPTRWVQWDRQALPYLATVVWSENAPLTLLLQNREQTEEQLLAVDQATGRTTTLLVERDPAWLNLAPGFPRWLAEGAGFLWATERQGAWSIEHRGADGTLRATLTSAGLGFRSLAYVDAARQALVVTASADPLEAHVYRIPFGQGSADRLTTGEGQHTATFGAGDPVWVDSVNPRGGPKEYIVMRGTERIGVLRSVAETPDFSPNLELTTIGSRDYRAAILRPRNFDATQRYPVLVSVYGGPHAQVVLAAQSAYYDEQWLADHGYIVVSIDGRGTPNRGREWERAIARNFIDAPLADQIEGLQALGARYREMDLSRVGIYGWSFGGYFAAMAVMKRPDVFHAAVSGAPVTDWRDYDTHYTERYLGLPATNREGYDQSSVLTFAPSLERPLLIIHGTVDDNVYFTHAVKLSNALLRANRPHQFLPLAGFTHMVSEPEVVRGLQSAIVRFFEANL